MTTGKRVLAVIGAILCVGWLAGCDGGDSNGSSQKPAFKTYDQAVQYYTTTFPGEKLARGYSQAISNATYFVRSGEGIMTLEFTKTPGKTYIFRGVPSDIWNGLKTADNKGGYYNTNIADRFTFTLSP